MTVEFSIHENDIKEITELINKKRGFDLSYFKPAFLTRRISVRMKMLNITNSSEYAKFLNSEYDEINSLYDSLSINVTKFYRDKHVWQVFANQIIPELLNDTQPHETIRIWSCGCASGEEPYSLAIMFKESLADSNKRFKILATDINSNALEHARKGVYTYDNLKNLDAILITKYFKKISPGIYKINDTLRDLVSFNVGDITTFPISYQDVIFCRNLLIYYGKDAQDLIFKKFYTVLKSNRYLVLGMDETLWGRKYQNSFLPLNPRDRIYQKNTTNENISNSIAGKKNE